MPQTVAVVVKGYPRLSETFIAQEILALQRRGLSLLIVSLRHPAEGLVHDLHRAITAPVLYLPEYLHDEPWRVLRSVLKALGRPRLLSLLLLWGRDFRRDPSRNRLRRLGQSLVLAAELPGEAAWLYAHYIHTPGSVARYAARLTGRPFSMSAHARDVWTIKAWEKREKLLAARWTVTCSAMNDAHLRELAPRADIELLYHGLDLERFRPALRAPAGAGKPFTILCVARAVEKKGLDLLLDALARLPPDLPWRLDHAGGGDLAALRAQAERLGLAGRIAWHGLATRDDVLKLLATADAFALAARVAGNGDRDGLPNAILEAMAMGLPVVASRVAAIPEAITDGRDGLLVPPGDAGALAAALERLGRDLALRAALGARARATVEARFGVTRGIDQLVRRFEAVAAEPDLVLSCASVSTHP